MDGWDLLVAEIGTPISEKDAWVRLRRYLQPWPTPREELRDRLNARLRGEDPGQPFSWKGLR